MKHKPGLTLLVLLAVATINPRPAGLAQGTAFTYQGRLQSGTGSANGSYDLAFSLYAAGSNGAAIAGPVTNQAVNVTNGLFTTTVDFGNVFNGTSNWLQIAVSTNSANTFSTLMPRQPVTPVPYALFAAAVAGLNIQQTAAGAPDLISGSPVNFVSPGIAGATISGGGATNYYGTAYTNSVTADFGTIAGGYGNTVSGQVATIAGGAFNTANGYGAMVAGGSGNSANGRFSFAAGDNSHADNDNSFVWADGQNAAFASTSSNQFLIRAGGGVGIGTTTPGGVLSVATPNGTASIVNGQFTPELVMAGGGSDGTLRVRNRIEMWPKTNLTAAGYLDVRNTNGTAVIELDGGSGALHAPGAGINTGTFAFIQRTVAANTLFDRTVINNPVCDGDPNAILIITHNWTSDTNSTSKYNTTPIGVYYTGSNWAILNEDQSAMALGRAFNVLVIKN